MPFDPTGSRPSRRRGRLAAGQRQRSADEKMPWLPLYVDEVDAADLLGFLNSDADVAFIVADGPGRWVARRAVDVAADGWHCLWHWLTGALPLFRGAGKPDGVVGDPWAGWAEETGGADPSQPYFGVGHPGIIWWNLWTRSRRIPDGIGLASFEWIGNYYRMLGAAADARTEAWWAHLREALKKRKARRIPRRGPLDGPVQRSGRCPPHSQRSSRARDDNP
jgi:hypothetical protein